MENGVEMITEAILLSRQEEIEFNAQIEELDLGS